MLGGFRHRLVDGAREVLTLPRPPAKEQRGNDRHGELLTGDVEGMPHLRGDGRQIVRAAGGGIVAAVHHDASEREVHEVRGLEVGPGPNVTERRHPRDDQGGTLLHQRLRAQPQLVELAPGRRLQQHVGAGHERAEAVAVFRLPQVEHDRALPAVVLPEEQGALGIFAILVEGADTARGAAAWWLHLDNIGTQTRQRQPTVLPLLVGQLDDADAGERTPAGREGAGKGRLAQCFHRDSPHASRARTCSRVRMSAAWMRSGVARVLMVGIGSARFYAGKMTSTPV
jgi:hypothetical protein